MAADLASVPPPPAEALQAERAYRDSTLQAFRSYARLMRPELQRRRVAVEGLPPHLRSLVDVAACVEGAAAQDRAVAANQRLFTRAADVAEEDAPARQAGAPRYPHATAPGTLRAFRKAPSVLRQLVREWSTAGAAERNAAFHPILAALGRWLPVKDPAAPPRVLIPGVGAGRLLVECCARGYDCLGNDVGLEMLFASALMLNGGLAAEELPICAAVHDPTNRRRPSDLHELVRVPDLSLTDLLDEAQQQQQQQQQQAGSGGVAAAATAVPSAAGSTPEQQEPPAVAWLTQVPAARWNVADWRMGMAAGEFLDVFGRPQAGHGTWDAVVTCFFIDTAPNPLEYLWVIRQLLRPGGVWVNLGPLHYHWAPSSAADAVASDCAAGSVELPCDQLLEAARRLGFDVQHEQFLPGLRYNADSHSLSENHFAGWFVVATVKPADG